MSDFMVETQGLRARAGQVNQVGDRLQAQASAIQTPSTMMMGIFMAPFMSAALPAVTDGVKRTVAGSGRGYLAFGGRLESSAESYEEVEAAFVQLIGKIGVQ